MNTETSKLKVAIVHDYLNQYGGAERCLEIFHELFPCAPVFTLMYDKKLFPQYSEWDIRPSFLQNIPCIMRQYRYFLFLFPFAVKTFKLDEFDIIISITHAWAKGINSKGAKHISFCLTPIRYVWDLYEEYMKREHIPFFARAMLPIWASWVRRWDIRHAQNVDTFIAISNIVAERVKKYYGRESTVVYPPVNTTFYNINGCQREKWYLTVSRLKAYKRIDLIIEAFNTLGKPLKIIGNGPEYKKLRSLAGDNIEFLTDLNDEQVRHYYQRAKGFIFAGLEDFGIVMAEAQACGLPVIAYAQGGAREIVENGGSGLLFETQSAESLIDAIYRFEKIEFDETMVRTASCRFDTELFKKQIRQTVGKDPHND